MTTQRAGIFANLGIGALGAGGSIFSPKSGTMAATFATSIGTFRTGFNTSIQSVFSGIYGARTSLTSLRFGTNMLTAFKDIKLIVPSENSNSDEEEESPPDESGGGNGGEGQL